MAEDDRLDCLELLQETPAIVRGLVRGLSHDDAHWKPGFVGTHDLEDN